MHLLRTVHLKNTPMEGILEKLNRNEVLSDSKEKNLYYYIQNQLVDDETRGTMNIIIQSFE